MKARNPYLWPALQLIVGLVGMAILILIALASAGCGPVPAPRPLPPVPPLAQPWAFDVVVQPPGVATVTIDGLAFETNADGYLYVTAVPRSVTSAPIRIERDGFDPLSQTVSVADLVAANDRGNHNVFTLTALHVDPSGIPIEQLARIRGAMWTARLDLPWGPRPGSPDNILPFAFYALYPQDQRARMVGAYKARGYTHAVVGPMAATDCYHGKYPCHDPNVEGSWPADDVPIQAQWDVFLDRVQELWDAGLTPIYFHKPDGWERPEYAARLDALDALARQPRAQQLLRVVVYAGWEPNGDKYGWPSATWVRMAQRGADVFPTALRLLHTTCDLDAPTGGNDDAILGPNGNAVAWQRVAPFLHGWLMQVCGYVDRGYDSEFQREWPKAIQRAVSGFRFGVGGWPTSSAFGSGRPLKVYAGEYAAYRDFWSNAPESEAVTIGNVAIQAGADGYLDGGSVDVP